MPRKTERRRVDRKKVRKRAEERHSSQGGGLSTINLPEGIDLFIPKKGRNVFDILPYEITVGHHPEVKKGELWYQRTFWMHRGIGPEEKNIVCPLKTIGKPCPVCEEYNRLRKDPDADEDVVKALKPKERELYNVIDLGKDSKGQIQILEMSFHCFGKQLEEELSEGSSDNDCFSDLEGGKSLKVRFSEETTGKYTYLEASRIDFVERDQDYKDSILDDVMDLDRLLKILPYDEIQGMLMGDVGGDDSGSGDEDDPKETERKSPRKSHRTRGNRDDDEDDQEPKAEPEEDEGDYPKGRKECVACAGSGYKSGKKAKGECPICDGEGHVAEEDEEDEGDKKDKKRGGKSHRTKGGDDDDPPPDDDDDW